MADPDACVFGAAPDAALVLSVVAPLTVVFDRRSGQTHLLASPLPELLTLVADAGPDGIDADTAAHRLAAAFAIVDEGDACTRRDVVAERLAELAGLGLIDRLDPCAKR